LDLFSNLAGAANYAAQAWFDRILREPLTLVNCALQGLNEYQQPLDQISQT